MSKKILLKLLTFSQEMTPFSEEGPNFTLVMRSRITSFYSKMAYPPRQDRLSREESR